MIRLLPRRRSAKHVLHEARQPPEATLTTPCRYPDNGAPALATPCRMSSLQDASVTPKHSTSYKLISTPVSSPLDSSRSTPVAALLLFIFFTAMIDSCLHTLCERWRTRRSSLSSANRCSNACACARATAGLWLRGLHPGIAGRNADGAERAALGRCRGSWTLPSEVGRESVEAGSGERF